MIVDDRRIGTPDGLFPQTGAAHVLQHADGEVFGTIGHGRDAQIGAMGDQGRHERAVMPLGRQDELVIAVPGRGLSQWVASNAARIRSAHRLPSGAVQCEPARGRAAPTGATPPSPRVRSDAVPGVSAAVHPQCGQTDWTPSPARSGRRSRETLGPGPCTAAVPSVGRPRVSKADARICCQVGSS